MRTAVHTESHTYAATHTPTALHVDTGELHRNTHPHTSCTHAEPHTHTRTHTRSHTAVLLASQPGKTIACSEGTQSPATCARPSTRTRPHPAGHVLTPAWARPHPAVTHAEPKVGVCVHMDMGSRDTGQPGETSSPAGQTPGVRAGSLQPQTHRRPLEADAGACSALVAPAPCPALRPRGGASGTAGMDGQPSTEATEQGARASQTFLPPARRRRALFLPFLGLGGHLPAPGLSARGSPR